jgi:hypothetical protein
MSLRQLLFAVGLGLGALAIFLVVLWSPERQVRLHQEHLLSAISKKNWPRMASFIAEDYSDRWGHDKAFVLSAAHEVFGQFLFPKVTMDEPAIGIAGQTATVSARLQVTGQGSPIAQMIVERIEDLREPFIFRWQQRSAKPWDWVLVRFDQRELELPE